MNPPEGGARVAWWRACLEQLQAAENRGDTEEAFRLRRSLVGDRLALRAEVGASTLASGDFALLDRLCGDLRLFGFHEESLIVARSAAGWAERQGDSYGMAHFLIKAAHSCLSLLDFQAAREFLARVLPDLRQDRPERHAETLKAVGEINFQNASQKDLREFRAELTVGLAALWAATGRLGAADRALAQILADDSSETLVQISASELALRLGEIRLDRGDFDGYGDMRAHWGERKDLRWVVLDGSLLLLQARFSEADVCLRAAIASGRLSSSNTWLRMAQWQRIHGLCALNRVDEAEELLDSVEKDKGISPNDLSIMRSLIQARRASGPLDFGLPPSVREILEPSSSEFPDERPDQHEQPPVEMPVLRRTRERVRDDWATIANKVQLHLHSGENDEALRLFLPLTAWTPQLDSPLLSARLEYLWSLVAHYAGDYGSAEEHSREARQRFQELGMPQDEWAACRVNGWALERQRAPRARVDAVQAHAQRLLESIRSHLSKTDSVSLSLNKWSVVEEQISQRCRTLRNELNALEEKVPAVGPRLRKQHRLIEDFLVRLDTVRRWGGGAIRSGGSGRYGASGNAPIGHILVDPSPN